MAPKSGNSKRGLIRNLNTTSFNFRLDCTAPFGEPIDIDRSTCDRVADSILRAASRIERVIFLPNPVSVYFNYSSFCNDGPESKKGGPCNEDINTLGFASSNSWHQFSKQEAEKYGLDSDYLYPASLVRQYLTNQTLLNSLGTDMGDMYVAFNSDWNWWFYSADDMIGKPSSNKWGPSVYINGGFYNQSQQYSFDIEQVILHELLHGLGMQNSWNQYVPECGFLPGYIDTDENGFPTGISPSFILTRWFADSTNGLWFSVWSGLIRSSFNQFLTVLPNLNRLDSVIIGTEDSSILQRAPLLGV